MNQTRGEAWVTVLRPMILHSPSWSSCFSLSGPVHRVRKLQVACAFICVSALSGCEGPSLPQTVDQKIVASALEFLASDGKFVCVDNATSGPALGMYEETMLNRPVGMAPPAWFVPATLRPPAGLSGFELLRGAQTDTSVHIAQPANITPALAVTMQNGLNQAALQLSRASTNKPVFIGQWNIRGVLPRWWMINRIATHCEPNYRLSNHVSTQDTGFITVIADHWATTYAFGRHGANWAVVAQWSNWIY